MSSLIDHAAIFFDDGQQLYMSVVHKSASGLKRTIKIYTIDDLKIVNVTCLVADTIDAKMGKNSGVIVHGCGFDAGLHLITKLNDKFKVNGYNITLEYTWLP